MCRGPFLASSNIVSRSTTLRDFFGAGPRGLPIADLRSNPNCSRDTSSLTSWSANSHQTRRWPRRGQAAANKHRRLLPNSQQTCSADGTHVEFQPYDCEQRETRETAMNNLGPRELHPFPYEETDVALDGAEKWPIEVKNIMRTAIRARWAEKWPSDDPGVDPGCAGPLS